MLYEKRKMKNEKTFNLGFVCSLYFQAVCLAISIFNF